MSLQPLKQLKNIASWLRCRPPEYRALIMGFDTAGKTTLLYQLKLPGQTITTIPTIGFNVETVTSTDGQRFTFWDVGGCDKIRPLYRHYFPDTDIFFFIVDCTDVDRANLVTDEIQDIIQQASELGRKNIWLVLNKQDLLPEDSRETTVLGLRKQFEQELGQYSTLFSIRVYSPTGFTALNDSHATALLDEAAAFLENAKIKPTAQHAKTHMRELGGIDPGELEKRAKQRIAQDEQAADEFWDAFLHVKLTVWDHYNHLKAGYFILILGFPCGMSLMKCAEMFLDHLETMRAVNPSRFRNTTHKTMTVFWLHVLHQSIIKYIRHRHLNTLPSREDFPQMLLHCPELMESGLWKQYYRKDIIAHNAFARKVWVPPELRPFPLLELDQSMPARYHAEQANSDHVIGFALRVVQETMQANVRRGTFIKAALSRLQTEIMQMRASDQQVAPYSETQAYFWIQYVHAAVKVLQVPSQKVDVKAGWHGSMNTMTLPAFKALFDIRGNEWMQYYSESLWTDINARMHFINPDKRPLPGVIFIHEPDSTEKPLQKRTDISMCHKMGQPERLADSVAAVCDAAAFSESDGVDAVVKIRADLIVFLYDALVADAPHGDDGPGDLQFLAKHHDTLVTGLKKAMRISGPVVSGITHKLFWIQQVLVASQLVEETCSFDDFMNSNPHLAIKELPLLYYSDNVWKSQHARQGFVSPDVKAFPSLASGGLLPAGLL